MLEIEFAIALFLFAAAATAVCGMWMTHIADRISDRTGLGEALVGGLLLGMSTSPSGTVTSVSAAWDGLASLAVSNAVGGIAVQTVFRVIADLTYRHVNLEHAAADAKNLLQANPTAFKTCVSHLRIRLANGAESSIALFEPLRGVELSNFGILDSSRRETEGLLARSASSFSHPLPP